MKNNTEEIKKKREYSKKYREKHLNKDKKFLSVRVSMDEGNEIKEFIKKYNMPIKQIITEGVEQIWEEIYEKSN